MEQQETLNLEQALAKNLDKEGLIRLKAVEKTIEHLKDRNADLVTLNKVFEIIYKQLQNESISNN